MSATALTAYTSSRQTIARETLTSNWNLCGEIIELMDSTHRLSITTEMTPTSLHRHASEGDLSRMTDTAWPALSMAARLRALIQSACHGRENTWRQLHYGGSRDTCITLLQNISLFLTLSIKVIHLYTKILRKVPVAAVLFVPSYSVHGCDICGWVPIGG